MSALGQKRTSGADCFEYKRGNSRDSMTPSSSSNSRPHDVPLSDLALSVLKGAHMIRGHIHVFGDGVAGFSNWSRSKEGLDAVAKVKGWTLHDLRRTAATRMADLGVQPHIIEAVLNHISGHKAGVAGIYNRSAYAPRSALRSICWPLISG